MTEVADLYVTLRGVTGEFNKSMAEAGAASERADGKIAGLKATAGKMALGFGAAAVTVGVVSVKLASEFDRTMEQIHTLAGVPQQAIKGLSASVLTLAGQVGFAPNSLAEALYHIESNFYSVGLGGKQSLDALKVAAEGAQIGHANLVDVTNALGAAIASGIPGVQNYSQAMGALLAIVGSGDMQMQDLANALGTGVLAVAKQYGATLADVGAGLATFGDNNIRGQVAATDLRMAIMDLTKQSPKGQAALEGIGIAAGQLAKDMQSGGMNKAMIDLKKHLDAAGVTGTKVGSLLIDAFTKKSSAPLAILLGQFDRLESKYPALAKGAGGFQSAWQKTSEQFAVQVQQIKAQGEAWAIQLGNLIIPVLTQLIGKVMDVVKWFGAHKKAAQELGTIVKDVLVGGLIMAGAVLGEMAIEAAIAAAPFVILAVAIGALANYLVDLYKHNAKFKAFVDNLVQTVRTDIGEVVSWIEVHWPPIWAKVQQVVGDVVRAVGGYLSDHKDQIKAAFAEVGKIIDGTVRFITAFVKELIHLWETSSVFRIAIMAIGVAIALLIAPITTVIAGLVYLWVKCAWFRDAVKAIWDAVRDAAVTVWHAIGDVITWFADGPVKFIREILADFAVFWKAHGEELITIAKVVWTIIETSIKMSWAAVMLVLRIGLTILKTLWNVVWVAVRDIVRTVWDTIAAFVRGGVKVVLDVIGLFADLLTGHWSKLWGDLKGFVSDTVNWIGQTLTTFASNAGTMLWDAGVAIMQGLFNGLVSGFKAVKDFVGSIAHTIASLKGPLPYDRQLLIPHGNAIMDGFNEGLMKGFGKVQKSVSGMALSLGAPNMAASPGQFGYGAAVGGGRLGSSGSAIVNNYWTIQGSVMSERNLADVIEARFLQKGAVRGVSYKDYRR